MKYRSINHPETCLNGGKEEALNSIRSWPAPVHPHQRGALNPLLSHQQLYDRPHPTEPRFRLTSQWGGRCQSFTSAISRLCSLSSPPQSTPPGRDQPFLFFGAERAATGRYGEGLSSCPTAPQSVSESLPTKTGLLHIPRFCIWMSRLLFSLKCTLNLSGNNREEAHTFSPTLIN